MIQNFSYHTHTNTFGIFDGHHSIEEMINQAAQIGYQEIGISNHFIYHPNLKPIHPMMFNDYALFEKTMLNTVEAIRKASENAPIKVLVGFEVDFFPSETWRIAFEKLRAKLHADYYIGSCHFLRDKEETWLRNMYLCKPEDSFFTPEIFEQCIHNYWMNIVAAVKSGYFDFIAHLDVYKIFPFLIKYGRKEDKIELIETLAKYHQPYELNTSGWRKCGEQHPDEFFLKELNQRNVPIVISDDAHDIAHLGNYYQEAENLLEKLNYRNRWKLK